MSIHDTDTMALYAIQDPHVLAMREAFDLYAAIRAARRARGHTARGALVLSYVAPIYLRKPVHGRDVPPGYREIKIVKHILPECVGTWWTPTVTPVPS